MNVMPEGDRGCWRRKQRNSRANTLSEERRRGDASALLLIGETIQMQSWIGNASEKSSR
jgi:hypothetical protein